MNQTQDQRFLDIIRVLRGERGQKLLKTFKNEFAQIANFILVTGLSWTCYLLLTIWKRGTDLKDVQ